MLILFISLFSNLHSQEKEFAVYPNGLIYNESTMAKLTRIADSLNLKFKTCDLNRVFYSQSQTIGHVITLKKGNIKAAMADMDKGISPEEFMVKYPGASIEKDVLVTKNQYKDYNEKEVVSFNHFSLNSNYGFYIESKDLTLGQKEMKNSWLYDYYPSSGKEKASIEAFYFPNAFTSVALPDKYARLIGYADCLIDTTTTKLLKNRETELEAVFVDVGLPENWNQLSAGEKEQLLEEMRGTQVMGYCSQDVRPRIHAMNIALLSAETANWEVFLKAHLDIMNDRFERMIDGSYAQGKRNTYIKELEELNINVPDLILGTMLRIENPAENHYFGSITRVGRALSETKYRSEIEDAILGTIADPELDDYNRIIFYFLFLNYTDWLPEGSIKKEAEKRLDSAVKQLPSYFQDKLHKIGKS